MIENEIKRIDGETLVSHVGEVRLVHYRNYRSLHLQLGKRFNLICGPNGQGKTNFLEALHLLATTRLLRGHREHEAIMESEGHTEVEIELAPSLTKLSVQIERGARKRALLNGLKLPRASDLIGRLGCVCISAQDMEIVRGDASERRLFLDLELSARSPAYLRHLSVYKRALEQRNALIKQARESWIANELWEVWEDQLAEHGLMMTQFRKEFVSMIALELPEFHERIGGGEQASVALVTRDDLTSKEEMLEALAQNRISDTNRGSTSLGPHRDDLEFCVGGKSARLFGSQGQQRTFVLALKLATLRLSEKLRGEPPLLLLDDIFSDLDHRRRSSLVEIVLESGGQTVLTCTEPEAAGPAILDQATVFHVFAGSISPPV